MNLCCWVWTSTTTMLWHCWFGDRKGIHL